MDVIRFSNKLWFGFPHARYSVLRYTACFMVAASFLWAVTASAENWPQWRGPFFNGSTTERGFPSTWSATDQVAWAADMPGPSAATPIIWGDHVFVASTDREARSLEALALDRKTGKLLWRHKVAEGYQKDDRSTYASSSPVTDGERVIFFYGNGALAAFDFAGKQLWARNIQKDFGEFAFLWTFSTSPMLYEGKLYLQVLQRDEPVGGRGRKDGPNESYLLALDPASGKTLWRVTRPSDAVAESREAFSTPIPFACEGRKEILVAGGDCISGHSAADGRELWRWGTWNPSRIGHWRLVPSPVAGAGVVLACAPKGGAIYAVKAGATGTVKDSDLAWTTKDERNLTTDVPTPLFYDGDFFVLSDLRRTLSRVDPKTGQPKWSIETPGRAKYEASPTGADGKIYLLNFKGEAVVVNAADGKILHTAAMGGPGDDTIRSSIAAAQGQLFIRTNSKLFCIGNKP